MKNFFRFFNFRNISLKINILTKLFEKIKRIKDALTMSTAKINIDKELPYFIIVSSIYESIGLPLLYLLSIDNITRLFRNVYKELLRWKKIVSIGINPIEALLYTALTSNSKKWKTLIINYVTLQRIGGSVTEFLNRKVEEALDEIKQTWKRYQENIVFIAEVFIIAIFSTIMMLLLLILLGSSISNMLLQVLMLITLITIVSLIIIDSILPVSFKHYNPSKYTIIASFLLILILLFYYKMFIPSLASTYGSLITLILLSTIILAFENFVHYNIHLIHNNKSILNLLDQIIIAQRYGISILKLEENIKNIETLSKRVKNLFYYSLKDKYLDDYDYKEKIVASLIIGMKYAGLLPYEMLLRLRNVLREIIGTENSTRKTLNILAILTIILPSILFIVLFLLLRSLTKIYDHNSYLVYFSQTPLSSYKTLSSLYDGIYLYSLTLSISLNTIMSKAVDLSIRSFWRTHVSLLLLNITYYLLLSNYI